MIKHARVSKTRRAQMCIPTNASSSWLRRVNTLGSNGSLAGWKMGSIHFGCFGLGTGGKKNLFPIQLLNDFFMKVS